MNLANHPGRGQKVRLIALACFKKQREDILLEWIRRRMPFSNIARRIVAKDHADTLRILGSICVQRQPSGEVPEGKLLGLAYGAVVCVGHSESWAMNFEDESAALFQAFAPVQCECFHIGSTAVPGLSAKPIVDMVALFDKRLIDEDLDHIKSILHEIGYTYVGDKGGRGGFFFEKLNAGLRIFALQVHARGSRSVAETIAFRDMLRADGHLRNRYEFVKLNLSGLLHDNRRIYVWWKSQWIEDELARRIANGDWCEWKLERPSPGIFRMISFRCEVLVRKFLNRMTLS